MINNDIYCHRDNSRDCNKRERQASEQRYVRVKKINLVMILSQDETLLLLQDSEGQGEVRPATMMHFDRA
jgi:hypothetical protein